MTDHKATAFNAPCKAALLACLISLMLQSGSVFGKEVMTNENSGWSFSDTTANPQSDTLRWNAVRFTDLNTNQSVDNACQFITYGKDKIDWIQKNGNLVYSMTIDSVADGAWVDASMDGSVTYHVSLNNLSGTLIITLSGGAITIVLNLAGGSDKVALRYNISNFDTL